MLNLFRNPVFVIGTGRCGSTLLRHILDSHRDIVMFPNEGNTLWHPRLYPYKRRLVQAPPFQEDPREFTRISLDNWPAVQPLKIWAALNYFFARSKGTTLAVKSPMITFLSEKLLEMFPGARFVHLYRDGYAVARSWIKKDYSVKWQESVSESKYAAIVLNFWARTIEHVEALKSSPRFEGRVLEVGYAEICEHPRESCGELASFIGVDPEGYDFDLTTITNRNKKHVDSVPIADVEVPASFVSAMRLKGYA